ncbi:MAG: L-histidine N(alpha)-methyltransferase [Rivularia sp. (in: cyanobacteria)]
MLNFNFEQLLDDSVNERGLGWNLCFVGGEDQSKKLTELTKNLSRGFSPVGDGKQILSGFMFWGIGPTISWAYACNDPLYLVMKEGIDSFAGRWRKIRSKLQDKKYHYVSLGVGTGTKDKSILRLFLNSNPDLVYFPVDMSSEMLRLGIQGVVKGLPLKGSRIFPIQLDFSIEDNVIKLRKLLDKLLGDSPILFSLLGNTLANFQHDTKLLKILSKLMRHHDRFLLEVAVTEDLSEAALQEAVSEYVNSKSYKEFLTSALLHNTDLDIDLNNVFFDASVEENKAIYLKGIYRNTSGHLIKMMLFDRSSVNFPDQDTIRLSLTRKYINEGINQVISATNLSIIDRVNTLSEPRNNSRFGMDLILLAPHGTVTDDENNSSIANAVWKN